MYVRQLLKHQILYWLKSNSSFKFILFQSETRMHFIEFIITYIDFIVLKNC
jgi:hypothetical protein